MKKSYETPLIEVINLEEDIIVTSGQKALREQQGSEGGINFGDLFGGNN